MRVAIITDTHYGARKGAKGLHDYFRLFYDNVFFPTLEKEGIDTIIHMGDMFDSRKSIDYQSLEWSREVVFEPMKPFIVEAFDKVPGMGRIAVMDSNALIMLGKVLSVESGGEG